MSDKLEKLEEEKKLRKTKRQIQQEKIKRLQQEILNAKVKEKEFLSKDALKIWKKIKPLFVKDVRILEEFLINEEIFNKLLDKIKQFIEENIELKIDKEIIDNIVE